MKEMKDFEVAHILKEMKKMEKNERFEVTHILKEMKEMKKMKDLRSPTP